MTWLAVMTIRYLPTKRYCKGERKQKMREKGFIVAIGQGLPRPSAFRKPEKSEKEE